MKIHIKGRPKPHLYYKITCLDSIMMLMLNSLPGAIGEAFTIEGVEAVRKQLRGGPIYLMGNGANLIVGDTPNEYLIIGFMPDGSDVLAGVEELKMLDALRKAKGHFAAMKKACYNPHIDHLNLLTRVG